MTNIAKNKLSWSGLEFLCDQAFTKMLNVYFESECPQLEATLMSSSTEGDINKDISVVDYDNETITIIQSDANQLVTLANRLAFLLSIDDDGIRLSASVLAALNCKP